MRGGALRETTDVRMILTCDTCRRRDGARCGLASDPGAAPEARAAVLDHRRLVADDCPAYEAAPYRRLDYGDVFDPPRFLAWGEGARRVGMHAPGGVISVVDGTTDDALFAPGKEAELAAWLVARKFPVPSRESLAWLRGSP